MARPNRQDAGDAPVSGLGQFRYCNKALWKALARVPPGPVLPAMSRLTVFTATSALQLPWGL